MDLKKGAGLVLDVEKIPMALHSLIPYVERWGFESNADQDSFVLEMQGQCPSDVAQFNSAMDEMRGAVSEWEASLPFLKKGPSELSDEEWEHPYWCFLNALKTRELTGYEEDDPEVLASRARVRAEIRSEQYQQATADADNAFKQQNYDVYVSLLRPFKDRLTRAQEKKLSFAVRKLR